MLIDELLLEVRRRERLGLMIHAEKIGEELREAFVIKAQNVADYLYESSPKDEWIFEEDFPDVAPPMPRMWIEWRIPPLMNVGGKISQNAGAGFSMGVLLSSVDLRTVPGANTASGIRWLCSAYFFGVPRGQADISCFGGLSWYVTDEGRILRPDKKWLVITGHEDPEIRQQITDFLSTSLYVPLLTLSFMHCKNVETVAGPAWDLKIQKARIARGKLPLIRWHTVVIDPLKKAVAAANGGDSRLSPKALHVCRGHWKVFEGKGLFGKYFGRYWWTEHERGSPEHGIVLKDYLVKGAKPQ